MLSNVTVATSLSNILWLRNNLPYVNEAFGTEFDDPATAADFVATYEDDDALKSEMAYDDFCRLHEAGDACVIIDRFAVFDRKRHDQTSARASDLRRSRHRYFDATVSA